MTIHTSRNSNSKSSKEQKSLFTGNVTGIFVAPSGGVTTGVGTPNFTWGTGTDGSPPNSFSFNAVNFRAQPEKVFRLGQLTYFNGTTVGGSESGGVQLSLSLDFDSPERGGIKDTTYQLQMNSTPNNDNPDASADFVNLGTGQRLPVTLGKTKYTLEILGFGAVSNGGINLAMKKKA